jgi:hypothetical protein
MNPIIQANQCLLKKLRDALDTLDPGDIEKLAKPEYRLELVVRRIRVARQDSDPGLSQEQATHIINELEKADSREGAQEILKPLTRESLEVLLRALDVPFQRKDSKDDLLEKVEENTIGFRLRSAAISKPG